MLGTSGYSRHNVQWMGRNLIRINQLKSQWLLYVPPVFKFCPQSVFMWAIISLYTA